MARFDNGWFKLNRSDVFRFEGDGYTTMVFALLNCWANLKDRQKKRGAKEITIKRGDVLTSIAEIANFTGFAKDTVRRALTFMTKNGTLVSQRVYHGMLITIVNYPKKATVVDAAQPSATKENPKTENSGSRQIHTCVDAATTLIEELRIEKEEREREARETHSPPLKSQLLESEPKIENSYASQLAKKAPPIERNNETIVRQPTTQQEPLESILEPIEVWRLYTAELGKMKAIKTFSPTPSDLNFAQQIASELVTEEAIVDAIKKYLAMDRPIYQERVWPLKFLSEDLTMVLATKGKPNPQEEELKKKRAQEIRDEMMRKAQEKLSSKLKLVN